MTTQMHIPPDHALAALFKKRAYDDLVVPKLGINSPKLGPIEYDPMVDKYPEEIHHRIIYAAVQCGSYMREGWYDLVLELDDAISKIYPLYTVDQVKEKFGGLRYYIGILPDILPDEQHDEIYRLIHEAEEKSYNICDICGGTGKSMKVGQYLIATRCEKHNDPDA